MKQTTSTSPPSLNQALLLMQQEAYPSARAICQQHLHQRPSDFNARHLLGVIQLRAGQLVSACRELERACKLPVAPRFRAQALNNLALALQQRQKPEQALAALAQAIALTPSEMAAHLNLLSLLEQLQRWAQLLAHADRFPALHSLPDAQLYLARAERHQGQARQAADRLRPSIGQQDSELDGEWVLACSQSDRLAAVLDWCQTQSLTHWQAVADYLAEEGARDTATVLYRALLQRDPDNASVRHLVDAADGRIGSHAPQAYVQALYDRHASQFEQHLTQRLHYQAPALLAARLAQHLPSTLGQVADLGCGSGLLGQALRQHFQIGQLTGCDLSAGMLQQARLRGDYDRLEQSALQDWLAQNAELALICATDVLIYTGDLTPILQRAAAALQAQGWFAFTVEESECPDRDLRLADTGRYQHSASHIAQAAQSSGLTLQLCERFALRTEDGKTLNGLMVLLQKPQLP